MKTRKGLSGSTLKMIAVITMFIDHVGAGILGRYIINAGVAQAFYSPQWAEQNAELVEPYAALMTAYWVMRMIGRIAFPIYCFLLIEGFEHTSNVKRYVSRLAMFCLISEIPFDLVFNGTVLEFGYQNVFFTLLVGVLVMWACRIVEEHSWWNPLTKIVLEIGATALGMALAEFLRTDYAAIGVVCIMALYVFRKKKSSQLLAGCVSFAWEFTAPLAFIPIAFYNGKRGWNIKYFFYAFYPLHLLLIWFVSVALGMASVPAF